MRLNELKSWCRYHYPKIFGISNFLTKLRIKKLRNSMINQEDKDYGESSFEAENIIVKKYKNKWKKCFQVTNREIDYLFRTAPCYKSRLPEEKEKLRSDMLFCRLAYGFQPDEYLFYDLEKKSAIERRKYVSDIERYIFVYTMGNISDIQIFMDKTRTYKYFSEFYKRDAITITGSDDFEKFINFARKHPTFVLKNACASRGSGVRLIESSMYEKDVKGFFKEILASGKYLIEEKINQGKDMAVFNKTSVNTLRCITINTKNGIKIPYTFAKIGRSGSFVDNGGAGGILVGIDNVTGIMNTDGYNEMYERFECHPDSGVVFKGYKIPDWENMLQLCRSMASKITKVKYVGWDVAYTDNGWVIVEGNMGQFIGPQILLNRGIKHELEKFLQEI